MEEIQKHLYVLILAGGGGTRLWPQSRDESPKQFVKLFSGKSLFRLTYERARAITDDSRIFVGTSYKYLKNIKAEAPGIPRANIIAEPMRRDTAMAHGIGSLYIFSRDPDSVVVNFASDHLISPLDEFTRQIRLAASTAYKENDLVTVGIKPRFAHSGMGHIKAHRPWSGKAASGLLQGEKFVEKPPIEIAEEYTKSGKYFWNANLYVFRSKYYLDLLKKHSPKTCTFYPKILEAIGTDKEKETIQHAFQMAPSISIDYAVSEKLTKFVCIPGDFNWTDVGDWKEVYNNLPKDSSGNVIEGPGGTGNYIGVDSRNNLLFLDKKIVATVGLENMVIIDTPDALLICPMNQAQGVKKIVESLKEQNMNQYL